MKSLFIAFLVSAGFIFSACPSPTPPPGNGGGNGGGGNDTLIVVPPDTTLKWENPGPVVGNDTTAIAN
jgi:hypothetical protein